MREDLNREKMHKAIDSSFSGLNGDPWLFQRISARASEGEIHMKKKLSAGLVLALILVLLAAAALAVTLLTHREIMEQVAVPLALENDAETVGVNRYYSAEELAEIARALNENGILEEDNPLTQLVADGQGWYEDSVINAICSQAFGPDPFTWTPEQIKWYEDLEYMLGHVEAGWKVPVPGENNMTREEAEAFALSKLRAVYGQELPLEDRSIWGMDCNFIKGDQYEPEDRWEFWLYPKDLEHGRYRIGFNDRNPAESAETTADVPDWTKPYTGLQLEDQFLNVYGWFDHWPQSVRQKFHEMMLNAELDPESGRYSTYVGFQLTNYPDPHVSDFSPEEAARIAKEVPGLEQADFDSAVLAEYEGERSWLVGLALRESSDPSENRMPERFVVSVDPVSGSVRNLRKIESGDSYAMAYIAEKAYNEAHGGTMKLTDAIPLAMETIRKEYPQLGDPADINEYAVDDFFSTGEYVRLNTRNPKHGGISVWFNPDGTVESVSTDPDWGLLTGDNLLSRYTEAYGSQYDWDQSRWVQLDRDMESLSPERIEGMILKSTHYPEESSVSIQRRQAQELGIQASGLRTGEADFCVLVDAQPHPVWILNISSWGADTLIIGIDAETGAPVFTERYITDVTPQYALYSLPETWRKLELEIKGAPHAAKMAVLYHFVNPDCKPLEYFCMEDGFNWDLEVDGLTVRYTGRWKGMKSYEVELDENGTVLRCEETDSEATEERPAEEIWEKPWIWGNTSAPEGYWKRMEEAMETNEADFGCLADRMVDWTELYGPISRETWPKDMYAIGYVLMKIRPSEAAAGTIVWPEF